MLASHSRPAFQAGIPVGPSGPSSARCEAKGSEWAPDTPQGLLGAFLDIYSVILACRRRSIGLLGGAGVKIHLESAQLEVVPTEDTGHHTLKIAVRTGRERQQVF